MVKNPPAKAGDTRDSGLIPGSGRSPRVGNGSLFQCSCLENPQDRGIRQATKMCIYWGYFRFLFHFLLLLISSSYYLGIYYLLSF